MNPLFKHCCFLVVFLSTLLLNSTYSIASGGNPVTPLTQVNKEFLVIVHLIRTPDGSLPFTQAEILSGFSAANTMFAPIAVSFKVCEFRIIDNYEYNTIRFGTSPEIKKNSDEIKNTYAVDKRINVYCGSELFLDARKFCGVSAGAINNLDIPRPGGVYLKCVDAGTIAHEFGHFFGLPHTFEGEGDELANGSNCSTEGDLICDTPADPYVTGDPLNEYITSDCRFISMKRDASGNYYDPDVSNIMSYYSPCICSKFSHDQYEKMANNYLSNRVAW